jgi:hypothetical protein
LSTFLLLQQLNQFEMRICLIFYSLMDLLVGLTRDFRRQLHQPALSACVELLI